MRDADADLSLVWLVGLASIAIFVWMVRPALDSRRWNVAFELTGESILMGLLAIGFFALIFQNMLHLVPVIILAVVVHEYGHVLAYRLAGHRAPTFRLIPFGGVAMSDEPPRNQVENAYVALMGPGFSVILVAGGLLATLGFAEAGMTFEAQYALEAVIVIGLLNAFNLMPFFPLDGGQTLRAIATTVGLSFAHVLTLIMSGLLVLFAVLTQTWILIFFALIGLGAVKAVQARDPSTPRMGIGTAILAMATYGAVFAVHAMASAPVLLGLIFSALNRMPVI
ncbi:MAG: site-2 protease family protein [Pseudomonadota bacterium]